MPTQHIAPYRRLALLSLLLCLCFLGIALTSLTACEQVTPFDRKAMLLQLADDVVIPSYKAFAKESATLGKASKALCNTTNATTLKATRDAWRKTKLSWASTKIFRFGPAESLAAHAHIDYWPSKTHLIEKEVASDASIDADYIDQLGASRRGLPAIEYLLYQPSKTDEEIIASLTTKQGDNRRCQLLAGYSDGVVRRAKMLVEAWETTKGDARTKLFLAEINKEKSDLTLQPAIDELTNEILFVIQVITDKQFGGPLGLKTGGDPQPDAAEAPYSQQSIPMIKASLEGVRRLYMGTMDGKGGEGKGMSALLAHRTKRVDDHVKRDMSSAFIALERLKQPSMAKALTDDKANVENAWGVVKILQATFKAEVVGDLGVTLVFSDLDGD